MGANKFSNGSGFIDLRLSLHREDDRILSALSFYDVAQGALDVKSEYEADWAVIEAGVSVLRHPESFPGARISAMGDELGRAAFGPRSLAAIAAHLQTKRVRIWIRAVGELAKLPWEAVSIPEGNSHMAGILSMHPGLSIIRDAGGLASRSKSKPGRTRVLIVRADPSSIRYPHLPGAEIEARSIARALASPECRNFDVEELQFATPASLARSVAAFHPDIVHFIGHGDQLPTGGVIVLESGKPNLEFVYHGDELAKLLSEAKAQLVVLSGCMTAEGISGVAADLAAAGVPAVVGMQAPLHDGAAGMFARAFYGSLGSGETIDESVLEGRCAIRGANTDWAVPVVLRTPFEGPTFGTDYEYELLAEPPQKRHNLTYDDRPFIGRQQERIDLRDRICVKHQRLVTLTGMGGMGKTRLAKQVSAEVVDDFPDGVWMVECDTFDTRDQLVAGIASTLGISGVGYDLEEAVVRFLESRKLLLFLDCFERIVEHASFLDLVLKQSSGCQMIVTSRVVLGLSREFEYRLNPMGFRKTAGRSADSMALFTEAASHSQNSFEVTSKNRSLILDLCKELEGVPLAIVLAAGRLKHLSLTELSEQVKQHPLEVLRRRGGPKDRQADLYRVVASSFTLLGKRECRLLDKLSLFVGGFYVEDAADVCDISQIDMTNGLSLLRDHSLLQVQIVDNRSRFKLLDTVREFLEQLPRDEFELAERQLCAGRHAERYARLSLEVGEQMAEGRWSEGTARLWSDLGNFRVAIRFSAEEKRYELIRKLAMGLSRTYYNMALNADFEELSRNGFEAATALSDMEFESKLLGLVGAYAATSKNEPGWRSAWGRRAEICDMLGDLDGTTDALFDMAWESFLLKNFSEADNLLNKATQLAEGARNYDILANCHFVRARMEFRAGNPEKARLFATMARNDWAQSDNKETGILLSQHLTDLYTDLGEVGLAKTICVELLPMSLAAHRYRNVAWTLLKLAEFHEADGELPISAICLLTAVKLQAEFPSRQGEKSKSRLAQLMKRHDLASETVSVWRKTSWQSLINELPYMKD